MKHVVKVYKTAGDLECKFAVIDATDTLREIIQRAVDSCKRNGYNSIKMAGYIKWDGIGLHNWLNETLEVSEHWFRFSVTALGGEFETRAHPVDNILNPPGEEIVFETQKVKAAYEAVMIKHA